MASINIVRLDEDPHESANGIRMDTTSRGVDLEGAKITVNYADGTVETLTWKALDPYTFGGATGEDVKMSYGNDWHELTTTKLVTSLEVDLQPASSVFDTTLDYDDYPVGNSTPTSKNGFPFELAPQYDDMPGEITASYSGIVNLSGSPAVGDLYTTMTVDFSQLPEGGLLGDLKWNSDIDTMKVEGDLKPSGVPCLARGTLITTDRGDIPVEDLKPGVNVLTKDYGYQKLVLTMNRTVDKAGLRKNPKLYPVRITAGALGAGLPRRDLIVSRQHRMVVKSDLAKRMFGTTTVLVAAIKLTRLPGIEVDRNVESVTYFHLVFERHEVVFAEGAPTESFLVNEATQKALGKAHREEFLAVFPEAADVRYLGLPAHTIPTGMQQKKLVQRHWQKAKDLLSL